MLSCSGWCIDLCPILMDPSAYSSLTWLTKDSSTSNGEKSNFHKAYWGKSLPTTQTPERGKRGGEVCTINQIVTQLYIRRLLSAGCECNFLLFYFDLWKAERLIFHPYLIPLLFCLYNLLIHFMKTDPVFCTPMDWIKTFTTPLLLNHLVLPI